MTTLEDLEKEIRLLKKDNEDLEERVRELELQLGLLTERTLRGSCSSCHLQ